MQNIFFNPDSLAPLSLICMEKKKNPCMTLQESHMNYLVAKDDYVVKNIS